MQDDLSIFERKYAMYIILAVSENPGIGKTKLVRLEEGNEKTKFTRINELIEAGYLKATECPASRLVMLDLTDLGQTTIAPIKKLMRIEKKADALKSQ